MTAAKARSAAVTPTETEYYPTILEGAHTLGWRAVHFRPARTQHGWRTAVMGDGKGWPDWILVHPTGGVLFVEVKRDGARADKAQLAWGDALRAAGAEWQILNVPSGLGTFWAGLADRAHRKPERLHHPLIAEVMAAADDHRGEWR